MIKSFLIDRQNNSALQQEYTMNDTVVFGSAIDMSGSIKVEFELIVPDWSVLTDSILGVFTLGEDDDRVSFALINAASELSSFFYVQIGTQQGKYFPIYSHNKKSLNTISFEILDAGINKINNLITHNGLSYFGQIYAPYWYTKNNGYGLLGDYADSFDDPLVKTIHDYAIEDVEIIDYDTDVTRHQWFGAGDWTDQIGSADGTYGGTYEGLDTFTYARNYQYEYVLEWFGRGGEYYQWLFTDWQNDIKVNSEVINEKNDNIKNIGIDETNTIELYFEDMSINDFDYLRSILTAKEIRRVLESGIEYCSVMPGSFKYKQSGLRFDGSFRIMKQKVNYV